MNFSFWFVELSQRQVEFDRWVHPPARPSFQIFQSLHHHRMISISRLWMSRVHIIDLFADGTWIGNLESKSCNQLHASLWFIQVIRSAVGIKAALPNSWHCRLLRFDESFGRWRETGINQRCEHKNLFRWRLGEIGCVSPASAVATFPPFIHISSSLLHSSFLIWLVW